MPGIFRYSVPPLRTKRPTAPRNLRQPGCLRCLRRAAPALPRLPVATTFCQRAAPASHACRPHPRPARVMAVARSRACAEALVAAQPPKSEFREHFDRFLRGDWAASSQSLHPPHPSPSLAERSSCRPGGAPCATRRAVSRPPCAFGHSARTRRCN